MLIIGINDASNGTVIFRSGLTHLVINDQLVVKN